MSNRIQGTTTLVGLLGYPIKHSKSPHMHNTAFEALGLDYVYMAFEVQEDHIKEGLDAMRILNAVGWNVTMPHKKKIIQYLDEVSEDAALIGSVNTVKNNNGKLVGYNTDGKGFVMALDGNNVEYKGKKVVIVGAGGAARAVATQLAYEGVGEIALFNRTFASAEEIIDKINKNIPSCKGTAFEMSEGKLNKEIAEASILINCTSLGMKETIDQAIISSSKVLHKDLFVADIVYDPEKTKLLKMAEEAGCKYMNGFMMLIWQGAIAFKIWTGKDMPVELIKKEIFTC